MFFTNGDVCRHYNVDYDVLDTAQSDAWLFWASSDAIFALSIQTENAVPLRAVHQFDSATLTLSAPRTGSVVAVSSSTGSAFFVAEATTDQLAVHHHRVFPETTCTVNADGSVGVAYTPHTRQMKLIQLHESTFTRANQLATHPHSISRVVWANGRVVAVLEIHDVHGTDDQAFVWQLAPVPQATPSVAPMEFRLVGWFALPINAELVTVLTHPEEEEGAVIVGSRSATGITLFSTELPAVPSETTPTQQHIAIDAPYLSPIMDMLVFYRGMSPWQSWAVGAVRQDNVTVLSTLTACSATAMCVTATRIFNGSEIHTIYDSEPFFHSGAVSLGSSDGHRIDLLNIGRLSGHYRPGCVVSHDSTLVHVVGEGTCRSMPHPVGPTLCSGSGPGWVAVAGEGNTVVLDTNDGSTLAIYHVTRPIAMFPRSPHTIHWVRRDDVVLTSPKVDPTPIGSLPAPIDNAIYDTTGTVIAIRTRPDNITLIGLTGQPLLHQQCPPNAQIRTADPRAFASVTGPRKLEFMAPMASAVGPAVIGIMAVMGQNTFIENLMESMTTSAYSPDDMTWQAMMAAPSTAPTPAQQVFVEAVTSGQPKRVSLFDDDDESDDDDFTPTPRPDRGGGWVGSVPSLPGRQGRELSAVLQVGPGLDAPGRAFAIGRALSTVTGRTVDDISILGAIVSDHQHELATMATIGTWADLTIIRGPEWMPTPALQDAVMKVAASTFRSARDIGSVAHYYILAGRRATLAQLYATEGSGKVASMLRQDFTQDRWMAAAERNAFVLLGRRQFPTAVAFFILAGRPDEAVAVAIDRMESPQLATLIRRLAPPPNPNPTQPPSVAEAGAAWRAGTYLPALTLLARPRPDAWQTGAAIAIITELQSTHRLSFRLTSLVTPAETRAAVAQHLATIGGQAPVAALALAAHPSLSHALTDSPAVAPFIAAPAVASILLAHRRHGVTIRGLSTLADSLSVAPTDVLPTIPSAEWAGTVGTDAAFPTLAPIVAAREVRAGVADPGYDSPLPGPAATARVFWMVRLLDLPAAVEFIGLRGDTDDVLVQKMVLVAYLDRFLQSGDVTGSSIGTVAKIHARQLDALADELSHGIHTAAPLYKALTAWALVESTPAELWSLAADSAALDPAARALLGRRAMTGVVGVMLRRVHRGLDFPTLASIDATFERSRLARTDSMHLIALTSPVVVTVSGRTIAEYEVHPTDTPTLRQTFVRILSREVRCCAVAQTRPRYAAGLADAVLIYHLAEEDAVDSVTLPRGVGHPVALALDPAGTRLACVTSGRRLLCWRIDGRVWSLLNVAIPGGSTIIFDGPGRLIVAGDHVTVVDVVSSRAIDPITRLGRLVVMSHRQIGKINTVARHGRFVAVCGQHGVTLLRPDIGSMVRVNRIDSALNLAVTELPRVILHRTDGAIVQGELTLPDL